MYTLHQELLDSTFCEAFATVSRKSAAKALAKACAETATRGGDIAAIVVCRDELSIFRVKTSNNP